ncbi:uncharacterized protein LOC129976636 [Argiope bruennichi]|uniref:uncharacterized protein LOC129976636 n=1 Tax=Argiope bruennichi TaxID=94029 RepID=UPI0024949D80|nr:uncharacterized protein LOC129976636 [Argiope bruennichi]XP_055946286.1 uncharacterized protein LOC129976636 [Argiope bruennichi]XP_055946287.1 uncharacterized protein LOC129976636 [Argiope bruennichi]
MEPEEKIEFDESSEEILFDPEPAGIGIQRSTEHPLLCRSIRIGTYKVNPDNDLPNFPVNLSAEAISFRAPTLNNSEYVTVSLRCQDVTSVLVHFGDDLPLMFIFTTTNFGENVRAALHLNSSEECYFDPVSTNEKIQKITFLIDSMTDEQRNFLRHCFPGDQKVTEIDQAEANKILVRSTPRSCNISEVWFAIIKNNGFN